MKAIVLCGGYATRLYPLTENKPKHLLNVGGKLMMEHVLEQIEQVPTMDHIYLVTNNKFYTHFEEWKQSTGKENITIINDGTNSNDDRLGSVGDTQFAIDKERLDDDILVIGADNLFEDRLSEVYETFKQKNTSVVAFKDIKDYELAKQMGIGALDENGRITEFVEKPAEPKSTLTGTLIYFIKKEDVPLIKQCIALGEPGKEQKAGEFIMFLISKVPVHGHVFYEAWFDIGNLDQLKIADEYWSQKS